MIELSRTLARQFRAVVRKSVLFADPRQGALVIFRAGRQGLTLFCQQGDIGVQHHTSGNFPTACAALPVERLAELENVGEVIVLEQIAPFKVKASWRADDGPQSVEFNTADPTTENPLQPARHATSMEPGFLDALDQAARTASRDAARYALHQVLLRGRDGMMIASDGRQLLFQGGFHFPWKDDRFLPALPVWGCRELPRDQPVRLGFTDRHTTLEVGPWLFHLTTLEEVKYPDVDRALPRMGASTTRLQIDEEDARILIQGLAKLPGHDDEQRPVTLDLVGPPVMRARDEKEQTGEVPLSQSKTSGTPLRVVMDRRYLLRALKLGFREICIPKPDQPLVCKDGPRTYVWMPLADTEPVSASQPSAVPSRRARSPAAVGNPESQKRPDNMTMNNPSNGQPARNGVADQDQPTDPVREAEELREQLHSALLRTSRLIAALKQQRRQNRVLETAMASLRRLQQP